MKTIPYPGYSSSRFDYAYFKDRPEFGSRETAGISPFQLPSGVMIEVNPPDCIIRFIYPNNEPAEAQPRRCSEAPDVSFVLGRYSLKILQIHFENARDQLAAKKMLTFDPDIIDWCNSLHPYQRLACMLHVRVIAEILNQAPKDLLEEIAKDLATSV